MSNPFEFREIMKAQFKFNETRTVDQVMAEHKRRHEEQLKESRAQRPGKRGTRAAAAPEHGQVRDEERQKVLELLSGGRKG